MLGSYYSIRQTFTSRKKYLSLKQLHDLLAGAQEAARISFLASERIDAEDLADDIEIEIELRGSEIQVNGHKSHQKRINQNEINLCPEVIVNIINLGDNLIEKTERNLIKEVLDLVGQNRQKASKILGVNEKTLRNKIAKYKREGYPENDDSENTRD